MKLRPTELDEPSIKEGIDRTDHITGKTGENDQ